MGTRFENAHAAANRVLRLVKKSAGGLNLGDVTVEPYKNGREKGWLLEGETFFRMKKRSGRRAVVFAEYRRSDDIVVYLGLRQDFDPAGNIPNDEVYEKAKFFSSPAAAATEVLRWLKG